MSSFYSNLPSPEADLEQGDILWPNEDLRNVLQEVHPYFSKEQYLAFCVVTQTCDLVRRDGVACRARHVEIAAVRSLPSRLIPILDETFTPLAAQIYSAEVKSQLVQLIERIINQNEAGHGLFYLHPNPGTTDEVDRLSNDAVVDLRVSVALKTRHHYPTLSAARVGRMSPPFQAKIGWMIGNLYSRAATEDYDNIRGAGPEQKTLIRDILKRLEERGVHWYERKTYKLLSDRGLATVAGTAAETVKGWKRAAKKLPNPRDTLIDVTREVFKEGLRENVTDEELEKILRRLRGDPRLGSVLKS